jgi:phenylalanyl-tRNA synthetase beta chain
MTDRFAIKQEVLFADFNWDLLAANLPTAKAIFQEIPKFPSVQRDLAIIVQKQLPYEAIEQTVQKMRLEKLQDIRLFDIFESEKLGTDKKSIAISFTFLDEEKTLTDQEIEGWMNRIMKALEKELQAEIRK